MEVVNTMKQFFDDNQVYETGENIDSIVKSEISNILSDQEVKVEALDLELNTHEDPLSNHNTGWEGTATSQIGNLKKQTDLKHYQYQRNNLTDSQKEAPKKHPDYVRYECHHCGYTSGSKRTFRRHIESVHLKLKIRKDYKCQQCEFAAVQRAQLIAHIEIVHLKLKKYLCHLCDYATGRKINLQKHLNSVHSNLKPYQCNQCDYAASVKGYLRTHINFVHLKIRNYRCNQCNYAASQRATLKNHVYTEHTMLEGIQLPSK